MNLGALVVGWFHNVNGAVLPTIEETCRRHECTARELQAKLQCTTQVSSNEYQTLANELRCKREECESLKKATLETRQVLTEEVANKHDEILQLKRDVLSLEDRCIQADKQTAFRDDIIKELRKEIRQLKQQSYFNTKTENETLKSKLEESRKSLENSINEKHALEVVKLEKAFKTFIKHKICLEKKCRVMEKEMNVLLEENKACKSQCQIVRNELESIHNDKRSLENTLVDSTRELDSLKRTAASCMCRIEKLSQENKSRLDEVVQLNNENRMLSETIDRLKQSFKISSGITIDEVTNLTQKIEELNNNIIERKEKQKFMEKEYRGRIDELNGTVSALNSELMAVHAKFVADIKEYQSRIEQLNNTISGLMAANEKYQNDNKEPQSRIEQLDNTVSELKAANEKYQNESKECRSRIEQLNNTICELKTVNEKYASDSKEYQCHIEQQSNTVRKLDFELQSLESRYEADCKVCKICRGKTKMVSFATCSEVQVDLDNENLIKQQARIQNKDEIIKVQSETINVMEQELEKTRLSTWEMRCELDKRNQENQGLQYNIAQLKENLSSCEERANNLQVAVDLYLNSINVLEASEEKSKIEIQQQRLTITNLQQALVATKQELDDVKRKSEENADLKDKTISVLVKNLKTIKENGQAFKEKFKLVTEDFDHLQDLNFNLELEYCNTLQDVDVLDSQINTYQTILKCNEESCSFYKQKLEKLLKQKQRNEEVIIFFKKEMTVMADQLCKLQEMLTYSNDSVQDEHTKVMHKFNEMQDCNEKLCTQLNAAEQQCQLEQQMNQLQESKIKKLQEHIKEKEAELFAAENTVESIRQQLQNSVAANDELQATVDHLHQTICGLKCEVEKYEYENCRTVESNEECRSQISNCFQQLTDMKQLLDKKTNELASLEMDYNNQHRLLTATQKKLLEVKEKHHEKQESLKGALEDVREKLELSEANHFKLCEDYQKLQEQLAVVCRREVVKDMEVKRYRKIVADLKKTLVELNKGLSNKEFRYKCKNKQCRKNVELLESAKCQDVCLNCPCEIEFYQSMVDNLKQAIIDLQRKLSDLQTRNNVLEKENKEFVTKSGQEAQCAEVASQLRRELEETKQDLQMRTMQLNDVKRSSQEISSSKSVQLTCAQEEIKKLKQELQRLAQRECVLNCEVDRLQAENERLQSAVSTLEEKSQLLKGQLELYLGELHHLRTEKEALLRKNKELINDFRSLQSSYGSMNKQSRCTIETAKIMEAELEDIKNDKDEICYESRNFIAYVREWLQEQRKINDYVIRKEKDYCDTIDQLKKQNKELQSSPPRPKSNKKACRTVTFPTCQSPYSMGSQGNVSVNDQESPSQSPCPDDCDWYSPSFRNETDDESESDEWVNKLDNLTNQVKKSNRIWQRETNTQEKTVNIRDFDVCRDRCKK